MECCSFPSCLLADSFVYLAAYRTVRCVYYFIVQSARMRQSLLFRKTYNLVTEDAADSKDCIPDDELLQHGVHFTAKVCYAVGRFS